MTTYGTNVAANSPLLTYNPPVGNNVSHGWVSQPFVEYEVAYITCAPKASVSFDFYGNQFSLAGSLSAPFATGPPCDFNVTVNGVLQDQDYYYHQYSGLPLDNYHVELDFFCPKPGQQAQFVGVAFEETQGTVFMIQTSTYLSSNHILTYGPWSKEQVYLGYYEKNFTQYSTGSFGSTLSYTFKGVYTEIVGAVSPNGSMYIVTVDGVLSGLYTAHNPVAGDAVALFFAQELDNNNTHTVTITNLGKDLKIQVIETLILSPYTGS